MLLIKNNINNGTKVYEEENKFPFNVTKRYWVVQTLTYLATFYCLLAYATWIHKVEIL